MSTDVKIIVTLGPATCKEEDLYRIKDKGINFVRVNMSHSTLEDLKYFIGLAKKVGIPFVIDTEGSQIRTGELSTNNIFDRFPEIGIIPIKFDKVFYSKRLEEHIHEKEGGKEAKIINENDQIEISGTQARKMFEQGLVPPEWFMRPEISKCIIEAIQRGEEVFVRE